MFVSSVIADFARSEDEDRERKQRIKKMKRYEEMKRCKNLRSVTTLGTTNHHKTFNTVKEAERVKNRMTMTIPSFLRFDIMKNVDAEPLEKKVIGKELNSFTMMWNSLNDYQLLTFSWESWRQSRTIERQRDREREKLFHE